MPKESSLQELERRLASLERALSASSERIRLLEDIEAIKQLRWAYSRGCDDNHNPDRLIAMFTDDAVIDITEHFGTYVEGRDEIYIMFKNNPTVNGITWTWHYYLQPLIAVAPDGKSAKGNWYLWEMLNMPRRDRSNEEEPIWAAGEYDDDYVKEDGVWKFRKIVVHIKVLSPYADGWVKTRIRGVR